MLLGALAQVFVSQPLLLLLAVHEDNQEAHLESVNVNNTEIGALEQDIASHAVPAVFAVQVLSQALQFL